MIDVAPNTQIPSPEHVTDAKLWTRREFGPASLSMVFADYSPLMSCQERLRKAHDAYERLVLGENVQVVSHDGRTVTYVPAQATRLEAYIRQLERECGTRSQMHGCGRARMMVWTR